MKKTKAFTLVELLVVIIIIWILAATIFPKLTGYLSRTRDLKRQADLRNIAAAIELYQNNYSGFPKICKDFKGCFCSFGGANLIQDSLSPYLSNIPSDPQKPDMKKVFIKNHRNHIERYIKKGQYLYQLGAYSKKSKDNFYPDLALLVAKMETPDMANYIIWGESTWIEAGIPWYWRPACNTYNSYGFDGFHIFHNKNQLLTCDTIIKSETPSITRDEHWKIICKYSDPDQLYYLIKIER